MKNSASIWTTCGALLTAILSSACCWLPLLMLTFGASALGIGSFFERYRVYLLGGTFLFLGISFYLLFFRKRCCDVEGHCHNPNTKLERSNKIIHWVSLLVVLIFAFFPNYVRTFIGSSPDKPTIIDKSGLTEFAVKIEGMACQSCAVHIQENIKRVGGVRSVEVIYDEKRAIILGDKDVTEQAVQKAVEAAGYKISSLSISNHSKNEILTH